MNRSMLNPRRNAWMRNALWLAAGFVLMKIMRRNGATTTTPGTTTPQP